MLGIDMKLSFHNSKKKKKKQEQERPSPRKVVDDNRTVYTTRSPSFLPSNGEWGQSVFCDLGEARIGNSHKGNIQPNIYKALEVLFGVPMEF